jgi:hypothetical protein
MFPSRTLVSNRLNKILESSILMLMFIFWSPTNVALLKPDIHAQSYAHLDSGVKFLHRYYTIKVSVKLNEKTSYRNSGSHMRIKAKETLTVVPGRIRCAFTHALCFISVNLSCIKIYHSENQPQYHADLRRAESRHLHQSAIHLLIIHFRRFRL